MPGCQEVVLSIGSVVLTVLVLVASEPSPKIYVALIVISSKPLVCGNTNHSATLVPSIDVDLFGLAGKGRLCLFLPILAFLCLMYR